MKYGIGTMTRALLAIVLFGAGQFASGQESGSIVGWGSQIVGVELSHGFVAIAAGGYHSLGLKSDGSIVGWGYNAYGQINVPTPSSGFVAIAAGFWNSLGLKANGSIVAWGDNRSGETNVPAPNSGGIVRRAGHDFAPSGSGLHSVPNTISIVSSSPENRAIGACCAPYACDQGEPCATGINWCNGRFDCYCFQTADGGSNCAADFGCSGRTPCPNGQSDCPAGEICYVNTCCGDPVCGPADCPVPTAEAQQGTPVGTTADVEETASGLPITGQVASAAECQDMRQSLCEFRGGLYQGDGVDCEETVCPGPTGACCNVAPPQRAASQSAGLTTFAVGNAGTGTMNWAAAVSQGWPWLRITSGASGVNGGIIFVAFDANPDPGPRTGTIRVSAPTATPPYVDVTVVQSGTAPPPQVTRFEFDPIVGPYMVNQAVPVTLRALTADGSLATGFNARVDMTATSGAAVTPNKVPPSNGTWSNGVWTGSVSVDLAHPSTQLTAVYRGITGTSNAFAVDSASPGAGCIRGFVFEGPASNPVQVSGADVSLYKLDGSLFSTQTTPCVPSDPNQGKYCRCGIPVDNYLVIAEKAGKRSTREFVTIRAGETVTYDLHLAFTTKPPVLLVGGVLGSTMLSTSGSYPRLDGLKRVAPESLRLLDPRVLGSPVWGNLRSTLEAHFTVINVPWDWRFPIGDTTITTYLLPAIDKAKRLSEPWDWDKVNVVAHSLGGILVRSYIQSDLYAGRNDIDRFAMVGTPNAGAAILYYLWEGGDTETADRIADANNHGVVNWLFAPDNFYRESVENLYRGTHGGSLPPSHCLAGFWCGPEQSLTAQESWTVLHDHGVGACDLLPTFPFLTRSGSPVGFIGTGCGESLLSRLNQDPHADRLVSEGGDPMKVRTKLFRSDSWWPYSVGETPILTVSEIQVGGPVCGLYPQGVPVDKETTPDGDGTVLTLSSTGISSSISFESSRKAPHARLMHYYSDMICQFLNDGVACAAASSPLLEEIKSAQTPVAVLEVSLSGRVQPYLLDPNGLGTGITTDTGDLEQAIPGSSVAVFVSGAGLSVDDPVDGEYELSLTALPEEVFTVDVGFTSAAGSEQVTWQGIHHDGVSSVTILLDSAASPALQVQGMVGLPVNIRAEQMNGLARIAWDASPDPAVTGYNVYGRPDDQPKFTLLGSTTGTTFDTGHPWVIQGVGVVWTYFVLGEVVDGTESLFDAVVENRSPLIAGMAADVTTGKEPLTVTFADASAGEVSAWAWDFDSDGTIDSTDPNPTHLFETAGSYTVTLTVGGPEGTDTTIRVGFILVKQSFPATATTTMFQTNRTSPTAMGRRGAATATPTAYPTNATSPTAQA
jgi:hypothetical protein